MTKQGFIVQICGKDPIWSNGSGIPSLVCTILGTDHEIEIWGQLTSLSWIITESDNENTMLPCIGPFCLKIGPDTYYDIFTQK